MNLVYLWIEDKNNKNNIGFNFGGKYRFLFKQKQDEKTGDWTNTLEISENPNYIENFYGFNNKEMKNCISSVTCCVGKNGAGKTTLLEKITRIVASKALVNPIKGLQICVWHDIKDNKYYICNTENLDIKFLINSDFNLDNLEEKEWDSLLSRYGGLANNNLDVIFYSNYFDETSNPKESYNDWNGFIDIRTSSVINYYARDMVEKYQIKNLDKIVAYNLQEMYNKINFYFKLSDNRYFRDIEKNINVNKSFTREYVEINPINLYYDDYKKLLIKRWSENKDLTIVTLYFDEIESYLNNAIKLAEEKTKSGVRDVDDIFKYQEWLYCHSYWLIILNYYSKLHEVIKPNEKLIKGYKEESIRLIDKESSPIKFLEETLKLVIINAREASKIEEYNINLDNLKNINLLNYNNFIKLLKELSKECVECYDDFLLENTIRVKIKNNFKKVKELLSYYSNSLLEFPFSKYSNFYWYPKLSSGENAFLTLLSRLYKVFNDISSETENVLLLIDEAELGFHPQWQKQYVSILILYLNYLLKIVEKDYINIQLIFTTNSPIPLSDILPNDIIYLDGHKPIPNSNHKSFGSDLYTLYCDTFFIDDGLIGNFAKYKINELIKEIDGDLNQDIILNIKKLINNIGDELVQNHLKKRLKRKEVNNNHD